MDKTHIIIQGRQIPLAIRRHRSARRISLRLSPACDGIVMTLPLRASVASGMKFFSSKTAWILTHVQEDTGIAFAEGTCLPVLGRDYIIRHKAGRGIAELADGELCVHGASEFIGRRVRDFLKKTLQQACLSRAMEMTALIGKTVREVRIRDTRSRWGSCSARGSLTFHWQLIFAPPFVLDYLIAHEVAHLAEMNHSPRFWQVVARLHPDPAKARRWLKREGHRLHRYGR